VVKDPVTKQMMFGNNPGDYDGYNRRWGGLPAFRDAVRSYQKTGTLVTLYTDPMRADRATRCGQQYGKLWGVIDEHGKYIEPWESWRMCLDVAEYRQRVADVQRAPRERRRLCQPRLRAAGAHARPVDLCQPLPQR
jgi:hypothetical protein